MIKLFDFRDCIRFRSLSIRHHHESKFFVLITNFYILETSTSRTTVYRRFIISAWGQFQQNRSVSFTPLDLLSTPSLTLPVGHFDSSTTPDHTLYSFYPANCIRFSTNFFVSTSVPVSIQREVSILLVLCSSSSIATADHPTNHIGADCIRFSTIIGVSLRGPLSGQ